MTIKDMKSILSTNKFDHVECNFKLKTGKPKVTLESLSHTVGSLSHTVGSLSHTVGSLSHTVESLSKTVESLSKTLQDVIIEMRQGFARQEQFNKQILARIDNLVLKNNLKE